MLWQTLNSTGDTDKGRITNNLKEGSRSTADMIGHPTVAMQNWILRMGQYKKMCTSGGHQCNTVPLSYFSIIFTD